MERTFLFIAEIVLLVSSLLGFIQGIRLYFRPQKPLFAKIIVSGLGCLCIGQLLTVIRLASYAYSNVFRLDMLAPLGCYFFLLSASFGQIDSLADQDPNFSVKYKLIPWAAPFITAVLYIFVAISPAVILLKIIYLITFILLGFTAFLNLKHAIYPDVENGIISGIKSYCIVIIILAFFNQLAIIASVNNLVTAQSIALLLSAAAVAFVIPMLEKGMKTWRI